MTRIYEPSPKNSKVEELKELVRGRVQKLRLKLLDLTKRNPLISVSLSPQSNSVVRVIDELPEKLAKRE